ncbi:unnamed protein product, partial [Gulo gulo]
LNESVLHLRNHCFTSKCLKTTKALKNTKILLRIGCLGPLHSPLSVKNTYI